MDTTELLRRFAFVVAAGLSIALLVLVRACAYRLWFHPLSKYPGPFWAKLTNWYAAYHAWKGDLHIDMWRCHERYGDHVRYAPNRVLFNNTAGLKDIYSQGKNVKKSEVYLSMVHRAPNTLTQRDKKLHARKRRLLSYGFSESAFKIYEEPLKVQIENFCHHLPRDEHGNIATLTNGRWSSPKNMARWCDRLAFDIMFDVVFGDKYEMVSKADNRPLLDAIATSSVRVGVMIQAPELRNRKIDKWLFPSCIAARGRFIAFVNKMLMNKSTEKEQSGRRNVFTILTSAKDPETGEGLRPSEIGAESTTLIVAGSDTTSTALTAFFFYVTRYPEVYAKVTDEIRTCFSSVEEVGNRPKLNTCTYLRACIDEGMRMSPSVGSSLWREVEAGGAIVDNESIPPGCDVGTGIYSIHHNPEYFPEPFTFKPERWLVNNETGFTRDAVDNAQSAFTPFSHGPRGCIGKGLALMEMMSILATVLYRFDMKVADGPEGQLGEGVPGAEIGRHRANELQLNDHVTAAKTGPVLQFRPRHM